MIPAEQAYYISKSSFYVMLLGSAKAKRKALFGKAFLIELQRGNTANATLFAKAFLKQNDLMNTNGARGFAQN